jgi:hypothetical protein
MPISPEPLSLSDQQMSAVMRACEPILPPDRSAFLSALATLLRGEIQPLGDGVLFRAIRSLQREFFRPPSVSHDPKGARKVVGPPIE